MTGTNAGGERPNTRDGFLPIWNDLRSRVIAYLEDTGKRFGPFTDTDFWVVDDDFGVCLIQVEVLDLDLLRPEVIHGLRALLIGYPGFAITVAVVPPKGAEWPRMGLSLLPDVIVDGLKRSYLPTEYRRLEYEGSRPD